MAEKYFANLPDQRYLYKSFASVSKANGTTCDDCGAFIQNIVYVVGSVDHQTYTLGLSCCEKSSKGLKNIKFDDKVAIKAKFWKGRMTKLNKFAKDLKEKVESGDVEAIIGSFSQDTAKKCATIDFTILYKKGDRWIMHENFPITSIYDKVKEAFAEYWDRIDWAYQQNCADAKTSKEVYTLLESGQAPSCNLNKYTATKYPEWDRYATVKFAVDAAMRGGWGYGFESDSNTCKLPPFFNKDEYSDIFDEAVANITTWHDLTNVKFVNNWDGQKHQLY